MAENLGWQTMQQRSFVVDPTNFSALATSGEKAGGCAWKEEEARST